jgi:hypothetical protein
MVYMDSVLSLRPFEALSRTAPCTKEVASHIELQNRRGGHMYLVGRVDQETTWAV